jgi:hypothetical protein
MRGVLDIYVWRAVSFHGFCPAVDGIGKVEVVSDRGGIYRFIESVQPNRYCDQDSLVVCIKFRIKTARFITWMLFIKCYGLDLELDVGKSHTVESESSISRQTQAVCHTRTSDPSR